PYVRSRRNRAGPLLEDAGTGADAEQASARSLVRARQAQVLLHVGLAEDEVAQDVVAAAVAAARGAHGDLVPLAEVLREVDLGGGGDGPGLALVIAHLEAAERAVEGDAVALERHERIEGVGEVDAVRVAAGERHGVEDVDVLPEH